MVVDASVLVTVRRARWRVMGLLLALLPMACGGPGIDAPAPDAAVPAVADPSSPRASNGSKTSDLQGMGVPIPKGTPVPTLPEGLSPIRFRVVEQTGISFQHHRGNDEFKHFPTSLGSGVAMFDYDHDGRLDLYFCSTRNLPLSAPNLSGGNKLYRNLGGFKFEDVTDKAGVGFNGFCHGVAVGDVNNDGHSDLYLTCYRRNVLYLNQGDGTFRDATEGSGATVDLWSTGAAFLDYDGDGRLDLYVSCYAVWLDTENYPFCGDVRRNIRVICPPGAFQPERHFLFKGNGDGTFVETTAKAGILRHDGRGLGIVTADINGDGRTDIYVANDYSPNFLFLNRGDGTFEDATESSGAATNEAGEVQGSMGVDAQDVDNDGRPELFVTNFRGQYNTLYRNYDGRNFQDVSAQAGLIRDSLPYVGWGCSLADLDADGRVDIFVTNGEVDDNLRLLGQEIDYDQPAIVWRNRGNWKFERVNAGPYFQTPHPGRGAAFGDLDEDGDIDVVINHQDRQPVVLSNESDRGHWVRFELRTTRSNRSAIGTTVEVECGKTRLQRQRKGGESYLSVNDPRLHFGLGAATKVDRVTIRWPSGVVSTLDSVAVDQTHVVIEPTEGKAKLPGAAR
ncbi:MAG: CRTAC1 family protein [Isosphaeraceae bacterium]